MILQILSILGLLISLYAFKIEYTLKRNKKYKALCEFNEKVSCSKAIKSKYGHLAGISNSIVGLFFYALIFILISLNLNNLVFYLVTLGFLGSIYLAYLSLIKLKTLCLICNSIYLINILLLIFSLEFKLFFD